MWILTSLKDANESIVLVVGRNYTIGRQEGDIIIPTDKSISRKHAVLQVLHPETNISQPHKPPTLTVSDTSKFGTIVRDKKLKGEQCVIKDGNQVKFGTMDSAYRAVYEPLVVTTSCLDPPSKKDTKALVGQLGGHVVSDWRKDCEILVMTNLSVTVKVICALVSQKPIVTVLYFKDYMKAVQSKTKLPKPDDYLPPLAESQLNPTEVSFQKDERRKTLFEGKVFIFLSTKQFKKLNVAVELAGGTPMLMEEGTDDNEDDILVAPHTCVMHCEVDPLQNLSQNATEWIQHVKKTLARHKRRTIPDSELGYAVLYCSTDRYCNPLAEPVMITQVTVQPSEQSVSQSFSSQAQHGKPAHRSNLTKTATPSPRPQTSRILAAETPSQESKRRVSYDGGPTVVPDTLQTSILHDVEPVVKTEPASQTADDIFRDIALSDSTRSPRRPPTRKKRVREEEMKDVSSPAAKAQRTSYPAGGSIPPENIAIKSEPVSPMVNKSRPEKNNNKVALDVVVKQSPKVTKASTSNNHRTIGAGLSDDDDNDKEEVDELFNKFDFGARRKTRRASRSPSPVPKSEIGGIENHARNTRSKRSPSPSPGTSARRRASPKAKDNETIDNHQGGPRLSPRSKSSKTTRSPSPKPVPAKRSQRSPSPKSDMDTEAADSFKSKRRKATRSDQPASTSSNASRRVKEELYRNEEEQMIVHETNLPRGPAPAGYLNKGTASRVPVSDEAQHDDQPSNLMNIETVSLVVRRPKPTKPDTACVYNGKNFKKFSKVAHAGANKLPVIIGASDLEVHSTNTRRLDEWFAEHEAELSQRTEVDQMFEFQPRAASAKKRTGRR